MLDIGASCMVSLVLYSSFQNPEYHSVMFQVCAFFICLIKNCKYMLS